MSVETKPNKLVKGLVLDTFHTDVDNTVATYALNSQLEDQEGNHFHYGSEVGTAYIKDILPNHVVIGHINMERNETVLFTTDGTNSTIGILSKNNDLTYSYTVKIDDTNQDAKLNFKKEHYIRGVYRLLNGCDQIIYFVDGINKDRRINLSNLNLYKLVGGTRRGKKKPELDQFIASLIASSGISSNINLVHNLSSLSSASSIISADLVSTQQGLQLIDAILNGNATLVASIIKAIKLESIAISNATISSNITKSVLNSSSLNAIADTDANVLIARVLQTNLIANASLESILEVITQGLVLLDTSLQANSAVIASIVKSILLENYVSASANINSDLNLTKFINSELSATSTIAVTTQLGIILNAQTLATSTVLAEAILSYTVNASLDAKADTTIEAQLSKLINLSVNAIGSTTIEAAIGAILLASITSTASVADAQLTRAAILNLIIEGKGTTDNNVTISKLMESLLSSSAQVSSTVTLSDLLNSTVSATAQTSATIIRSALVNSALTSTATTSTANITLADILSTSLSAVSNVTLADLISQSALDLYFGNTSLLIHADSGELQNNTFIDSSTNNFTITRNGNVTQGSFSPFQAAGAAYSPSVNGGSGYFDGSGDYLTIPSSTAFTLGNSPTFTIEGWLYLNGSQSTNTIVITTYPDWNVYLNRWSIVLVGTNLRWLDSSGNASISNNIATNQWIHFAIVGNSSNIIMYINGISVGTQTSNFAYTTQGGVNIGYVVNGAYFNGYISNLRIVKGTAVYTTNFTPPTAPVTNITNTSLLLNFTNGGIIDQTGKNNIETVDNARRTTTLSKFGGSSILFDGNGDYLTIPNNSVFNFGSDNFTIEFWIYCSAQTIKPIVHQTSYYLNTGWILYNYDGVNVNNTTRKLTFIVNNSFVLTTSSDAYIDNTWTYIAIVKNGTGTNNISIYSGGINIGSGTYSTAFANAATAFYIGATITGISWNRTDYFNGYLDEIRITKGVARYTTNFTPPTAAFANFGPSVTVDYLVVAGGGSGGGLGGGGAGGLRSTVTATGGGGSLESPLILNIGTTYTITVGGGGTGITGSGGNLSNNGTNSVFSTITSNGGGGGGSFSSNINGRNGGSGGGAGTNTSPFTSGTVGTGTTNQGYNGGLATASNPYGGGGGGAGAVGTQGTGGDAGDGGNGVDVSITGSSVPYGGGGGGGNGVIGSGGTGGGGTGGGASNIPAATSGEANKGGGGGGSANTGTTGSGGSGVVVLKIPNTRVAGFTVGVNYDLITSVTGYNIYNVKAAGTTDTVTFYDATAVVSVDYLVVAGGGGGGGGTQNSEAGGGGAGGYRTTISTSGGGASAESKINLILTTSYTVMVGDGGAGSSSATVLGTNGGNSILASITSTGGGGGGSRNTGFQTGNSGGSGGGGAQRDNATDNFGAGTANQGRNGGNGFNDVAASSGGGGGGADTAGVAAVSTTAGGNGGNGLTNTITAITPTPSYAGGGGGSGNGTGGTGQNGGGNGGNGTSAGTNASIYTGSGGGGNAGKGAKGVVIIKWLTSSATFTASNGAETDIQTFTDGSYTIKQIRNSGTITFS